MFHRRSLFLLLLVSSTAWPALAAVPTAQPTPTVVSDNDLSGLLRQMHANLRANEELAQQYVCDDSVHEEYFNKSGKKTAEKSEKVESVFVNGLLYHQIVEQNGKSVPPRKQLLLQKHEDAISELGDGFDFIFELRDGNPKDSIYSALPICCLNALFDNHVVRHETINGRDNLVIESVPKSGIGPSLTQEGTALDWKETTWVDVGYVMPTRIEAELLNDKGFLLKGTTLQQNYIRVEKDGPDGSGHPAGSVWVENYKTAHSKLKFLWKFEVSTFEDTSYNFKKFDAKMKVLSDSMRVLE